MQLGERVAIFCRNRILPKKGVCVFVVRRSIPFVDGSIQSQSPLNNPFYRATPNTVSNASVSGPGSVV